MSRDHDDDDTCLIVSLPLPSCLHSQSYSLNSLFAGSNANKEKRIGVPFAPFQAPLPSASKSVIHASATAAAETLPIDGTNNVTER